MKTSTRIILTLASLLAFAGAAHATTFTVDSSLEKLDNTSGLQWDATAISIADFILTTENSTKTFTYAHFTTSDFSLDATDLADTDTLKALLTITPPISGDVTSSTAKVDGSVIHEHRNDVDHMIVDFDNNWISAYTDPASGLQYSIKFDDLDITDNSHGSGYDLTATFRLDHEGSAAAPVPEPGTMMLLGLGMAGLAVYGKRRMNKEA